jgi:cation transport ATPase
MRERRLPPPLKIPDRSAALTKAPAHDRNQQRETAAEEEPRSWFHTTRDGTVYYAGRKPRTWFDDKNPEDYGYPPDGNPEGMDDDDRDRAFERVIAAITAHNRRAAIEGGPIYDERTGVELPEDQAETCRTYMSLKRYFWRLVGCILLQPVVLFIVLLITANMSISTAREWYGKLLIGAVITYAAVLLGFISAFIEALKGSILSLEMLNRFSLLTFVTTIVVTAALFSFITPYDETAGIITICAFIITVGSFLTALTTKYKIAMRLWDPTSQMHPAKKGFLTFIAMVIAAIFLNGLFSRIGRSRND